MALTIKEILAKSALTPSRIAGIDFALNPYRGCAHGCRYCYADFMQRFSRHPEPWGGFVDVKINIAAVLAKELSRRSGQVAIPSLFGSNHDEPYQDFWRNKRISLSTVTDPYQPLEKRYQLTRSCLEVLLQYQVPVSILTKSPLVCRDIDLIKRFHNIEVGLTITTDRDDIRKIFEPHAPAISDRIAALRQLHYMGIKTFVFIGPMLPMDPYRLAVQLKDFIDYFILDKMNYVAKSRDMYYRYDFNDALRPDYFDRCRTVLTEIFHRGC